MKLMFLINDSDIFFFRNKTVFSISSLSELINFILSCKDSEKEIRTSLELVKLKDNIDLPINIEEIICYSEIKKQQGI